MEIDSSIFVQEVNETRGKNNKVSQVYKWKKVTARFEWKKVIS